MVIYGEENQKEEKDKEFLGFTIDHNLLKNADKMQLFSIAPAYRSKEITDEIIENKRVIFDQAENRMHAQQHFICLIN